MGSVPPDRGDANLWRAAALPVWPRASRSVRFDERSEARQQEQEMGRAFAIKAEIGDPAAESFAFAAQKTREGGRTIAAGDEIFLFASENEGGRGLVARGVVVSAEAGPKRAGVGGQRPRGS